MATLFSMADQLAADKVAREQTFKWQHEKQLQQKKEALRRGRFDAAKQEHHYHLQPCPFCKGKHFTPEGA